MMLQRMVVPSEVQDAEVSPAVQVAVSETLHRIQTFQDRWDQHPIEQFVAADYLHVYRVLAWIRQTQLLPGNRFLEWGCGFAVVSAMASSLGFDSVGIEAEAELLAEGRQTAGRWDEPVELVHGNFLPAGSETLADDPTLPSLGHDIPCGYDKMDLQPDDFAIVYSYPWPGEDDFHEAVFDRCSACGAMLLQFCGPNDVRLWRKTK